MARDVFHRVPGVEAVYLKLDNGHSMYFALRARVGKQRVQVLARVSDHPANPWVVRPTPSWVFEVGAGWVSHAVGLRMLAAELADAIARAQEQAVAEAAEKNLG